MFGIGVQELAIVLVIALLVFGPKRLPELARTMGKGLAEFRRASSDLRQSLNFDLDNERRPSPTTPTRPAQAGDLGPQVSDDVLPSNSEGIETTEAPPSGEADALNAAPDPLREDEEPAREKSPVHSGD